MTMSTTNYFTSNDLLFKTVSVTEETADISVYFAKDKLGHLASSIQKPMDIRILTKKEFDDLKLFSVASFYIVENKISFQKLINDDLLIKKLHEIVKEVLKNPDFIWAKTV